MDMQKCAVCGKRFDFDREGLGGAFDIVCSAQCAKRCAKKGGLHYAIHNMDGEVVETNAGPNDVHIIHG